MNMGFNLEEDDKTEYIGYENDRTELVAGSSTDSIFENNKKNTTFLLNPNGTVDSTNDVNTFTSELHRKKTVLKYMDHVLPDNPIMKYKPVK